MLIHFTGTFIRQAKQIKETQVLNKQQRAKEALFMKEKRQSNKSLVILHDTLTKKTHDLNLVEANHAYSPISREKVEYSCAQQEQEKNL